MQALSSKERVSNYVAGIRNGTVPAGRWIAAAAERWERDLARSDLVMDWDAVDQVAGFIRKCGLVGDYHDEDYELLDWQLWVVSGLYGWKYRDTNLRRTRFAIVQVARGGGKTTLMAGIGMWDLVSGTGREVDIVANSEHQAARLFAAAKVMAGRVGGDLLSSADGKPKSKRGRPRLGKDVKAQREVILRKDADSSLRALPASMASLDGLNPTLWIGDEAHEWKGRFMDKLVTTGAKRRESLGVIITTAGSNPDNWYADQVKVGQGVLRGELSIDSNQYWFWAADEDDDMADPVTWRKANPGLPNQPSELSVRASWEQAKVSPRDRANFARYQLCIPQYGVGAWLDMHYWDDARVDLEALRGRPAWLGLDLSKSFDMSALVAAVPMQDGRLALLGKYWWPLESSRDREIEYGMPIKRWATEGRLVLTPGREVDYESIRQQVAAWREFFDVRKVAFDKWGSTYLSQTLVLQDAVPLQEFPMTVSYLGPACQTFQNFWVSKRLVFNADEIFRRACADVEVWSDNNGNLRPVKTGRKIIDPLMAGLMAVQCYSLEAGRPPSVYETSGVL